MFIKPLNNKVIILPNSPENKTKSGLFLLDTNQNNSQEGRVEEIGDKVTKIKIGDNIIFPKYGGQELKFNNNVYLVINEDDIIGIIKE